MERSKTRGSFEKTCTQNNSVAVGVYNCRSDCGGGILRICAEQDFCDVVSGTACFIRDLPQPDFISNFGIGNFQANLWTMIFTVQFYIITAIIYRFLKIENCGYGYL